MNIRLGNLEFKLRMIGQEVTLQLQKQQGVLATITHLVVWFTNAIATGFLMQDKNVHPTIQTMFANQNTNGA